MRRRRNQTPTISEPVNDTIKKASSELTAAKAAFALATTPAVVNIPANVSSLTDDELNDLREQLSESRSENLAALKQWELYGKHLQEALDATLLLTSLKGEPETKKRRRNPIPEFAVGASVAYRITSRKPPDDEWILCEVVRIVQEGATYEVRDPEPDEQGKSELYKANVRDMLAIPGPNASLPTYPPGSSVIAQYPETTTFYRAEVVSTKGSKCRLIFYGEEEDRKETEVDRHLVLKPDR